MLVHTAVNYFSDCTYPKGYDIAFMIYGVFIKFLFLNFYRQSYLKSKREAAAKKKLNGSSKKHDE